MKMRPITIKMKTVEVNDAVLFRVGVGTTGCRGGDGGHGGRTVLVLENPHRTDDIKFETSEKGSKLTATFKGDAELRNLITAIRWAADRLEAEAGTADAVKEHKLENIQETSITVE